MRQRAIKYTATDMMHGKWKAETALPTQLSVITSSSSSSMATGTADAAATFACVEKDCWKFFLLEWEDKITAMLQTELKCIWHDMAEQCNNNPLETLL